MVYEAVAITNQDINLGKNGPKRVRRNNSQLWSARAIPVVESYLFYAARPGTTLPSVELITKVRNVVFLQSMWTFSKPQPCAPEQNRQPLFGGSAGPPTLRRLYFGVADGERQTNCVVLSELHVRNASNPCSCIHVPHFPVNRQGYPLSANIHVVMRHSSSSKSAI